MASYVTFYDHKPSGPKNGPILSPVPDVVFDLYEFSQPFQSAEMFQFFLGR